MAGYFSRLKARKHLALIIALLVGLSLGTSAGVVAGFTLTNNGERPRSDQGAPTSSIAPLDSSTVDSGQLARSSLSPETPATPENVLSPNVQASRKVSQVSRRAPEIAAIPNVQAGASVSQVSRQLPTSLVAAACGDVNLDGSVNILQIVVGLILPTNAQKLFGNLDGNGGVEMPDAIISLQHIVGLAPPPSNCGPSVAG